MFLHRKCAFFAVLVTFALSSLSATIIFPILAPLFLSPEQALVRGEIPQEIRSILFGFFLMAFPLAQFIFAPLLGRDADHRGKRKVFLYTLILEMVGYAVSGFGIQYHHLSLLFLGRVLTGAAGGNMSVCLATLVDLSPNEQTKMRYFSFGSVVAGSMFVLGPFIGGKLSDATISSHFSLAFPMWVGSLLAVLNFFVIFFFFREKAREKKVERLDPNYLLHDVKRAFSSKKTHDLYLLYFFFLLGWNMLYQFLPALMVEEFAASSTLIGDVAALLGIIWIVGTFFTTLLRHWAASEKIIILVSLVLFAGANILLTIPTGMTLFLVAAGIAVFCSGGIWLLFTTAISNSAHREVQGKVLGLGQSIQSLSMAVAPFLGGFFLQAHGKIPFIVAAFSALLTVLLLLSKHRKVFNKN